MDFRLSGLLGERILLALSHAPEKVHRDSVAESETETLSTKIEHHFGPTIYDQFIVGKRLLDFGSGRGKEAVTCAAKGAALVVGVDTEESYLIESRARAAHHGAADRTLFLHPLHDATELDSLRGTFDVVYSLDAFEHFADPDAILKIMESYLAPGGLLFISFGPLWWHPRGSHMDYFTPIPWLQAFFTEETILKVRAHYRQDGFKTFSEAGLNQMTFARFEKLLAHTQLEVASFEAVPIRRLAALAKLPFFRELFTSVIRCRLQKPIHLHRPKFPAILAGQESTNSLEHQPRPSLSLSIDVT